MLQLLKNIFSKTKNQTPVNENLNEVEEKNELISLYTPIYKRLSSYGQEHTLILEKVLAQMINAHENDLKLIPINPNKIDLYDEDLVIGLSKLNKAYEKCTSKHKYRNIHRAINEFGLKYYMKDMSQNGGHRDLINYLYDVQTQVIPHVAYNYQVFSTNKANGSNNYLGIKEHITLHCNEIKNLLKLNFDCNYAMHKLNELTITGYNHHNAFDNINKRINEYKSDIQDYINDPPDDDSLNDAREDLIKIEKIMKYKNKKSMNWIILAYIMFCCKDIF